MKFVQQWNCPETCVHCLGPSLGSTAGHHLGACLGIQTLTTHASRGVDPGDACDHIATGLKPLNPAVAQARLMDSQKQALLGNRAALLLAAQKPDAAEAAAAALISRFPAYDRLPLLRAALLAHSGKVCPSTCENPKAHRTPCRCCASRCWFTPARAV